MANLVNTNKFIPEDRAAILIEALPYIQKFHGKIVVIKYGGNAMINEDLKKQVMEDIVLMKYVGINPVIVHGGGPDITNFMDKLGKQATFINGLRVTDKETITIAEMVLAGKINAEIVSNLNGLGMHAIGISGKDGNLIYAKQKLVTNDQGEQVDLGYVGEVEKINIKVVEDLLQAGYIPVISPIGTNNKQETFNINADDVAAEIAGALKAEKLILLTDIKGIYKNYPDEDSFISSITKQEILKLIDEKIINGGMIPKTKACLTALDHGATKACIIDGRQAHALLLEFFTNAGIGTEVYIKED